MHISSRANTILLVLILAVGVALVAMLATAVRGGPLDPSGAPSSTDGVREAGTPISSIPFTITQPGRYYVTRDLTGVANQSGITIAQSDVTVDLNGFTLHGVASTGSGVTVSGARTAITIENGTVRGWFNGIDAQMATVSRISGVRAIGNGQGSADGSYGIIIIGDSTLDDCLVENNKATGILAGNAVVRDCQVTRNGNDGIQTGSGVFLQNNRLKFNHQAGGEFFDLRFVGTNNDMTDNDLGLIGLDASSSTLRGVIARNTYCALVDIGPNMDLTQRTDNIADSSC